MQWKLIIPREGTQGKYMGGGGSGYMHLPWGGVSSNKLKLYYETHIKWAQWYEHY